MTHLPFIAAAYTIGVLIPAALGVGAWTRAAAAKRKLRAVDPRFAARRAARQ